MSLARVLRVARVALTRNLLRTCLLGLGLGWLLSKTVTKLLQWPAVISTPAALVAFGVAAGIGIFFGWYPARKAAGTDPIDALRFE